jgi:tRNA(adenine34) deaminase
MSSLKMDEIFMRQAVKEAEMAKEEDEVPVGAVVVYKGKIIGRAHNQVERLKDPTAHAEILAITSASDYLKAKWLSGAQVYVTIEPCAMCAGALVLARIERLIFAAKDPKAGACGSVLNIINHAKLNHRVKISEGVLEKECALLLSEFFKKKRK